MSKAKNGKLALLFSQSLGTLIVGDAIAALADNEWFLNNALKATGSALPLKVNYKFKSPDSGNAITPEIGDDVYPITLERICKGDATINAETGTIEVTDDCSEGYVENITDGFTSISGDIAAFMKFNVPGGGIVSAQLEFLNRFFDIVDDDGAGVYVLTPKSDADLQIAILQNSDQIAENDIQVWIMFPIILSSQTIDKPLKGGQNLDLSWTKGEGPATVYNRITNSEEVTAGVF